LPKIKNNLEKLNYNDFAEKCIGELQVLQGKFQKDYVLDWYESWFYNQSTGLLSFSREDKEVNFKYIAVGSFSEKSNTWKWSWDNEHTQDNVKEKANLVKAFGQQHGFSKLTDGYFPSDEFDAWEFAAIAMKLVNGIGVYRPVNDEGLQIFLVVTEFIDRETAQNIKEKNVECSKHEYGRRAFVCQHLNTETIVGFEEAFDTHKDMQLDDEDDFQAWCSRCEIERQKEDGWNETSEAFANIKIVCEACYFEMKELNVGHY
jgi:hypothetical protein